MTLIKAETLREKFEVRAKFYQVKVVNETFLMRREARIVRKGSNLETRANAVIVMLNPGSCTPSSEIGNGLLSEMKWVSANPDPTQYQLMRLMERMDWNNLTILNLSDICEGNSTNFLTIEKKFKAAGLLHSTFQVQQGDEPSIWISNTDELIFAWGGKNLAKRLAREFGLYKKDCVGSAPYSRANAVWHSTLCYPRHPYPLLYDKCEKWLDDMTYILKPVITHA